MKFINIKYILLLCSILFTHSNVHAYNWTYTNKTKDTISIKLNGGVLNGKFDIVQMLAPGETKTFTGKGLYCRSNVEINGKKVAGRRCASEVYNIYKKLNIQQSSQPEIAYNVVENNTDDQLTIFLKNQNRIVTYIIKPHEKKELEPHNKNGDEKANMISIIQGNTETTQTSIDPSNNYFIIDYGSDYISLRKNN